MLRTKLSRNSSWIKFPGLLDVITSYFSSDKNNYQDISYYEFSGFFCEDQINRDMIDNYKASIIDNFEFSFKASWMVAHMGISDMGRYSRVQTILGIYLVSLRILIWSRSLTLLFGYFQQDNYEIKFLVARLCTRLLFEIFIFIRPHSLIS